MMKTAMLIFVVALGAQVVDAQFTGVRPVLSEIFPTPKSGDGLEFIEIYNPTNEIFNFDGYKVCDGDMVTCTTIAGQIPPNAYYLLCHATGQIIDTIVWSTDNVPPGSSYVRGTLASDPLAFAWNSPASPGVGLLGGPNPTPAPAIAPSSRRKEGFVSLNEISIADRFIEIAYDVVESIASFNIVVYTPTEVLQEIPLSDFTPVSVFSGLFFATLSFSFPRNTFFGLALVAHDDEVLQFISIGGAIKPTFGPAAGITSNFIGPISAKIFTAVGSGCSISDFTFISVPASSPGRVNINQRPSCEVVGFINEILQGEPFGNFVEISYTSGLNPSALTLELYSDSGLPTQTFSLTDAIGGATIDGLKFNYFTLESSTSAGGFALSRTDLQFAEVLHFVSVGLPFVAISGIAVGRTATSIGVPTQNGVTSARLVGSGCTMSDFSYMFQASTPGSVNIGQLVFCSGKATDEFLTATPSASPSSSPTNSPSRSPSSLVSGSPTALNGCDPNPCHRLATCISQGEFFECLCPSGYEGNGLTTPCRDINECTADPYPCDPRGFCVDSDGSFSCGCYAGFTGNGYVCNDVNECESLRPCSPLGRCENDPGGFQCFCNAGYEGNGVVCNDIDECSRGSDNCSNNADCSNTDGSFTCTCRKNFIGNGVSCDPVSSAPTPAPTPEPTPGPTPTLNPSPDPTGAPSSPPSPSPSRSNEPTISQEPSDAFPSAAPSKSILPSATSFPSTIPSKSSLPSVTLFPSISPSKSQLPSITSFPSRSPTS